MGAALKSWRELWGSQGRPWCLALLCVPPGSHRAWCTTGTTGAGQQSALTARPKASHASSMPGTAGGPTQQERTVPGNLGEIFCGL